MTPGDALTALGAFVRVETLFEHLQNRSNGTTFVVKSARNAHCTIVHSQKADRAS